MQSVLKPSGTSAQAPTPLDVLRYRYHHGTNLGSVFVLERWLSPSMFVDGAPGESELDAVQQSLQRVGLDATRQKWEAHWRDAVSEGDWRWLVDVAHCSSIRLPIGYFTLGPDKCTGTAFDGLPAQVYINAWAAVKSFVARARSHGIGVLFDFHALPGGANRDAHSGTSSGQAALWGNQFNLDLAQRCLVFIAQETRGMDGVAGLQLCNEAVTDAPGMYSWYDSVIAQIVRIDAALPLYISDAWNLDQAIRYIKEKNKATNPNNPIVIDTHKYYTFAESDRQQSPQEIINRVPNELGELNGRQGNVFDHGAADLVVGEYSCVLDVQTWSKVDGSQRKDLTLQFGRAQSKRWQDKAGGSYFWTYKMDWMDGGDWGFAEQTKTSAIVAPVWLRLRASEMQAKLSMAQSERERPRNEAVSAHVSFWSRQSPGQTFEHWRYEAGWDLGFSDAFSFFSMRTNGRLTGAGGDKIGLLDLWVVKRIKDAGQRGGFVWEFEQGMRRGVADFYALVSI